MNNSLRVACACLTATMLISSSSQAQDKPNVFNPVGDVMLIALSNNGRYAASVEIVDQDTENPHAAGGSLIDLQTNTAITISAPYGWAGVCDITDDGIVVGEAGGLPGYWTPGLDQWVTFDVPAPWGGGCFNAVTPDGRYAVGYYRNSSNEFEVHPMAYDLTLGTPLDLTNLPQKDMSGENQRQNLFYGISPDGRYALGEMSQSYLLPVALFSYIYDLQENTWTPIGFDYSNEQFVPQVDGLHFINDQAMSPDGNWVTGSAYMVYDGGQEFGGTEGLFPYRYNVANNAFEVYTSMADYDVHGDQVTADGTVIASSPAGYPYADSYVRYGKFFIDLRIICKDVYNINIDQYLESNSMGACRGLSTDGLTAIFSTPERSVVIQMQETFADAASRIDLLGNYSPNIPDGSAMSALSEIKITFDREIMAYGSGSVAELYGESGSKIRNSSGFEIAPDNKHQLIVTFRTTALTPGEKYTIKIPANMIWLAEDSNIKNKEITLTYYGRNEGPVKLESITPDSGSALAQFNSNPDYIAARFDCQVTISPEASCVLYNADDNSIITYFAAAASGQYAYFYPTQTYHLYKGSNYKVVIGAGSITDISGAGPSEEIVLDYVGAYVRELSADDTYIFNSDCNTYDYFMMWKREVLQPASVPESWGFEPDNIWILLRDNEYSSDWALCAHSMYSPAGQSEDWLVTPQLYLPDANSYLAFDAQSYRKLKNDRIKVYIYEQDAVFNYLNQQIADAMLQDAELVFDERLSAGASDESIDGEWTHYTVPLSKYAGKNIYIAFLNQNYDQSAVFIDNIQVIRDLAFAVTNQTPASVVAQDQINVKGLISVASEIEHVSGIEFTLRDSQGTLIDKINDTDAELGYGDSYSFAFDKPLPLTIGKENAYTIEVKTGEKTYSYTYTVKDLMFEPQHRVVLEEIAGRACSNCPLGILAIENLQAQYPDNFIAVTIRTFEDDMYGVGLTGYTDFLGLSAAPTARVNRGPILFPALSTPQGYVFAGRGIVQSDGTEAYLWFDAVQDYLEAPAEASVTISPVYDAETSQITVSSEICFAMDTEDRSLSIYAVLLEDYLPALQMNGFCNVQDPALGEWGQGGKYAQTTTMYWQAMDVCRYTLNNGSYTGQRLDQNNFTAGETCKVEFTSAVPTDRISDINNCKVAVMLIDGGTQTVINSAEAKLALSGIGYLDADQATPTYYNLQGHKVANPQPGNVYIKVQGNRTSKIAF